MLQIYLRVGEIFGRVLQRREDGQGLFEYALILALVAVLCVGALAFVGGKVLAQFSQVTTSW